VSRDPPCENHAVRIAQTTTIARTPDEVWGFVADARNDPRWCQKVVSVEQIVGDGPGRNARYRVMHRPRPGKPPVELTMEVVEFDPPHRLRWREEDPDAVFNVLYELESDGAAARIAQVDDIDWKIAWPLRPLGRIMVSRDMKRQFAILKRLLENATPG
jgi:uncharacterized protein YndB with AHSA1/START domain